MEAREAAARLQQQSAALAERNRELDETFSTLREQCNMYEQVRGVRRPAVGTGGEKCETRDFSSDCQTRPPSELMWSGAPLLRSVPFRCLTNGAHRVDTVASFASGWGHCDT